MMDKEERSCVSPIWAMSTPSITIWPLSSSVKRNRHPMRDVLPAPVLPTCQKAGDLNCINAIWSTSRNASGAGAETNNHMRSQGTLQMPKHAVQCRCLNMKHTS